MAVSAKLHLPHPKTDPEAWAEEIELEAESQADAEWDDYIAWLWSQDKNHTADEKEFALRGRMDIRDFENFVRDCRNGSAFPPA